MSTPAPSAAPPSDAEKAKAERTKKALREVADIVVFPLISGILFGLGTAIGKRFGEWLYPIPASSATVEVKAPKILASSILEFSS